jgi:alpha-N-arabinofuranosidase
MRELILLWCWPVVALAAPGPAPASEVALPTIVTVLAGQPGPKIDRDIFGQFAEHLGTGIYGGIWVGRNSSIPNVRGIRSDVVGALRAIHVPNVRWPGGCFGDEYHWRNGIGPAAKRPVTLNPNWGGVIEPNSFGSDEFMDFLSQVGAEAFLSVNVGSGSPQEAAEWLEYLTADKPTSLAKARGANGHRAPYRVKYLGLGNENWGCGGAMSGDHYVEEVKRFARFARNYNPVQTDAQSMRRIAVGSDGGDSDYTELVMKAWKTKAWSWDLEGVSLHFYTTGGWPPRRASTGFGEADYAQTIKETLHMGELLTKQSAIMDRYDPQKKVILSVDEWGIWLAPNSGTNPGFLQQQNSQRDAVLAALNLDLFMHHADRVRLANIAQMVNVLQAMILTEGPKMVLTPTYHVFRMYVPFQDATFVPVRFDAGIYRSGGTSMPRVDAVAARDKDGKLWLALTNIDPNRPVEMAVDVAGATAGAASGEVLAAPRFNSVNTFDAPHTVEPKPISATQRDGKLVLTLPPSSVAVVSLEE